MKKKFFFIILFVILGSCISLAEQAAVSVKGNLITGAIISEHSEQDQSINAENEKNSDQLLEEASNEEKISEETVRDLNAEDEGLVEEIRKSLIVESFVFEGKSY